MVVKNKQLRCKELNILLQKKFDHLFITVALTNYDKNKFRVYITKDPYQRTQFHYERVLEVFERTCRASGIKYLQWPGNNEFILEIKDIEFLIGYIRMLQGI